MSAQSRKAPPPPIFPPWGSNPPPLPPAANPQSAPPTPTRSAPTRIYPPPHRSLPHLPRRLPLFLPDHRRLQGGLLRFFPPPAYGGRTTHPCFPRHPHKKNAKSVHPHPPLYSQNIESCHKPTRLKLSPPSPFPPPRPPGGSRGFIARLRRTIRPPTSRSGLPPHLYPALHGKKETRKEEPDGPKRNIV